MSPDRLMFKKLAVHLFFSSVVFVGTTANTNSAELTASMPSFTPFSSFDENYHCEGVISKLLKMIFTQANINFKLVNYPYARILHSLNSGVLDSALIFKNTSISQKVEYIGPVSKSKVIVLTSADVISNYTDLYKLEAIAVIRNAKFYNKFDNDEAVPKVNVDSYEQAVSMLKLNRVDAIVGSRLGIEYALRKQNMERKRLDTAFILGEKEWWIHMSKKSAFLKNRADIELAIKHFYKDDLVYQLYKDQLNTCLGKNNLPE